MFNFARNSQGRFVSIFESRWGISPQEHMEALEVAYDNNLLYEGQSFDAYWMDEWFEPLKPLRTPVNRSVEFFASKLCMGTPKIMVANKSQTVLDGINQVLKWSNFNGNKRPMLRKLSLHGNLFLKVNFDGEKVYLDMIDGKTVTDFELDSRGFLLWIRIDIAIEGNKTYTEYWTQEDGYMAIWEHRLGKNAKLEQLGTPKEFHFLEEFGVDFIPIVVSKFRDVGKKWGASCVDHALVKIDEVNRQATNLAEQVFMHKSYLIVETGRDNDGIALPAPDFPTITDEEAKKIGKVVIVKVSGANARWAVPNNAWSEFLSILKANEEELQQDLPELRYYTLRENELSGIAMRTLLAGALDRAKEAQENFSTAFGRAIAMALTMGRFFGVFPSSIGSFDKGDFEFSMTFEEIIPINTQSEKVQALASLANVDMPLQMKMALCGFAPEEIALVDTVSPNKNT